jgi:protein-L-isoaspartate(D-aspartate) O-methyltransferase
VLVVGAGSGYSAAVLAQVGKSVTALESDPVLAAKAKSALTGLAGVEVFEGPLPAGAAAKGPFDVILIEGAVLGRSDALLGQLAEGGRCVGISRETGVGRAVIWRRVGEHFAETDAFEASAGVLQGFIKAPSFTF